MERKKPQMPLPSLSNLPSELLWQIAIYLPINSLLQLARSNQTIYTTLVDSPLFSIEYLKSSSSRFKINLVIQGSVSNFDRFDYGLFGPTVIIKQKSFQNSSFPTTTTTTTTTTTATTTTTFQQQQPCPTQSITTNSLLKLTQQINGIHGAFIHHEGESKLTTIRLSSAGRVLIKKSSWTRGNICVTLKRLRNDFELKRYRSHDGNNNNTLLSSSDVHDSNPPHSILSASSPAHGSSILHSPPLTIRSLDDSTTTMTSTTTTTSSSSSSGVTLRSSPNLTTTTTTGTSTSIMNSNDNRITSTIPTTNPFFTSSNQRRRVCKEPCLLCDLNPIRLTHHVDKNYRVFMPSWQDSTLIPLHTGSILSIQFQHKPMNESSIWVQQSSDSDSRKSSQERYSIPGLIEMDDGNVIYRHNIELLEKWWHVSPLKLMDSDEHYYWSRDKDIPFQLPEMAGWRIE